MGTKEIIFIGMMLLNLTVLKFLFDLPKEEKQLSNFQRFVLKVFYKNSIEEWNDSQYQKIIRYRAMNPIMLIFPFYFICQYFKKEVEQVSPIIIGLVVLIIMMINRKRDYVISLNKTLLLVSMTANINLLLINVFSFLPILLLSSINFFIINMVLYYGLRHIKRKYTFPQSEVMDLILSIEVVIAFVGVVLFAKSIESGNLLTVELMSVISFGTVVPWIEYLFDD